MWCVDSFPLGMYGSSLGAHSWVALPLPTLSYDHVACRLAATATCFQTISNHLYASPGSSTRTNRPSPIWMWKELDNRRVMHFREGQT
jgi:hypothetical protein